MWTATICIGIMAVIFYAIAQENKRLQNFTKKRNEEKLKLSRLLISKPFLTKYIQPIRSLVDRLDESNYHHALIQECDHLLEETKKYREELESDTITGKTSKKKLDKKLKQLEEQYTKKHYLLKRSHL